MPPQAVGGVEGVRLCLRSVREGVRVGLQRGVCRRGEGASKRAREGTRARGGASVAAQTASTRSCNAGGGIIGGDNTLRPPVAPTTHMFVHPLSFFDTALAPAKMLIISAIDAGLSIMLNMLSPPCPTGGVTWLFFFTSFFLKPSTLSGYF